MAHALRLGRRGQGATWPNPAVGCVIVKDARVIGRGSTAPGGRPHAEPQALAQAGPSARGATAYVTLEPCAHTGKTPPCADALIKAGIARCVIATTDPDPRVSGRGIALLENAGVQVDLGCLRVQADADHAGFFSRLSKGRPKITLKLAVSLDGRIATSTGHSQWITGPMARRHVHAQRMRHDAVMVGGGTARADDPTLNVRGFGKVHQPLRIVASSGADFSGSNLLNTLDQAELWICHAHGIKLAKRFQQNRVVGLPVTKTDRGQLCVDQMFQMLGAQGLTSVYVEGGGSLAASLVAANLVDDVHIYSAGLVIGGDGLAGIAGFGLQALDLANRFTLVGHQQIGSDIFHHWQAISAP